MQLELPGIPMYHVMVPHQPTMVVLAQAGAPIGVAYTIAVAVSAGANVWLVNADGGDDENVYLPDGSQCWMVSNVPDWLLPTVKATLIQMIPDGLSDESLACLARRGIFPGQYTWEP